MIVSQIVCPKYFVPNILYYSVPVLYFASLHNTLFGIKVRQTPLTVSIWNQDSKMNTLVHLSLILIIYGPCLSRKYSKEFRGSQRWKWILNVHYLRKPSQAFHFSWVFLPFPSQKYILFIWYDNQIEFSRISEAFKQKFQICLV